MTKIEIDWNKEVELIGPKLFRFFTVFFSSEESADLVQETLIRLVRKYKNKKIDFEKGNLKNYSFGIARFVRLENIKRYAKNKETNLDEMDERSIEIESDDIENKITLKEEIKTLKKAINTLKEEQKQILSLLLDKDLTLLEISEIIEMPIGTVKSHIHRAKSELKKILGIY